MFLSLLTLCALVTHATGGCLFPPQMSGLAANSVPMESYHFVIDLTTQKTIFRQWRYVEYSDKRVLIFLDYQTHQRYHKTGDGKCTISPLDERLSLPLGMPDDAVVLNENPQPPFLPRIVTFRSKKYETIYVSVEMVEPGKCYPLGGPYVMTDPTTRIADHYSVRNETIDPSDLRPDLSNCI